MKKSTLVLGSLLLASLLGSSCSQTEQEVSVRKPVTSAEAKAHLKKWADEGRGTMVYVDLNNLPANKDSLYNAIGFNVEEVLGNDRESDRVSIYVPKEKGEQSPVIFPEK